MNNTAAPNNLTVPQVQELPWARQTAFDIRQQHFIEWKDYTELGEKLVSRIRALNLDPEWDNADVATRGRQ